MQGTTPNKATVSFPGVVLYEFKKGKISHVRNSYDQLGIAKQVAKGVLAKKTINSIQDQLKKRR
jgi:hypothetical protein